MERAYAGVPVWGTAFGMEEQPFTVHRSPFTVYDLTMRGLVVLLIIVTACTTHPATTSSMDASTSATAVPIEVERQKAAWDALGIDDYRATYRVQIFDGGLTAVGDVQYLLTVIDGHTADCESNVSPWSGCGRITDPTMFSWAARYDPEHAVITYDPEWHLPSRIEFDDPSATDDETLIELIEFEPMTARSSTAVLGVARNR